MNTLSAKSLPERICTRTDLDACLTTLAELDPLMGEVMAGLGSIPLRLRPAGYEGLAEIVVGQMVSKASASAIFTRLWEQLGEVSGERILSAGESGLEGVGLSRAKLTTLIGMAEANLDFDGLCDLPIKEARAKLIALKGIGAWTADVFLMFCAGHVDVFPAGDVALQQAIADIGLIEKRPSTKQADEIALRWHPVRAAASRVLWAEYARRRARNTLPV